MFVGLHVVFAQRLQTPELMIAPEEGDEIMKAAQNVLRHYSVSTTQKTLDWIALFGVLGGVYGTRFGAVMIRRQGEGPKPQAARSSRRRADPAQTPGSAEVVDLFGAGQLGDFTGVFVEQGHDDGG